MDSAPKAGQPRWLEYMPLDDLMPALHNAKRHDVAGIGASMARFGVLAPLALDERTGRLYAGHGRLESYLEARESGAEPPDGVVVTERGWEAPVFRGWASDTDDQAHAAGIALNQLTEAGGWEHQTLAAQLQHLEANAPDLIDVLGFPDYDVDVLLHADVPPLGDLELGTYRPPATRSWEKNGDTQALEDFQRTDAAQHAVRFGPDELPVITEAVSRARIVEGDTDLTVQEALAAVARHYLATTPDPDA